MKAPMTPWRAGSIGLLALALALGGCQTMSDVKPGQGQSITVADHAYDKVWDTTLKVVEQHFTVHEQSKTEGIILAERGGMGGGWIGIYFTGAGPNNIRVEVVRMGKYAGQIAWTNWPRTVLREVQASLGEPPSR
jgi:hypothetical protein